MFNVPWSKDEDETILAVIDARKQASNTRLAKGLISNPLFQHRSVNGLRVHIGYLKNGGAVSTTKKFW